jgi:membrane protease YdiL (CAAX protease family)
MTDRSPGGPGVGQPVALWEVLVFLSLIAPSMLLSFFAIRQGSIGFVLAAVATIFRDGALVSLILFFLWRNGEPVARIGWASTRRETEVVLGVGVFILLFPGMALLERAFRAGGLSAPSTPLPRFLEARGTVELLLAVVLVVVVAVAEETIFRGYLMLRFASVTGSPWMAVALSAAVFALGHGYEGAAAVATIGVMGVALGLLYLWRGSLVAPIVAHFLQDIVSIVIAPLVQPH